jgi:hypothetical protein
MASPVTAVACSSWGKQRPIKGIHKFAACIWPGVHPEQGVGTKGRRGWGVPVAQGRRWGMAVHGVVTRALGTCSGRQEQLRGAWARGCARQRRLGRGQKVCWRDSRVRSFLVQGGGALACLRDARAGPKVGSGPGVVAHGVRSMTDRHRGGQDDQRQWAAVECGPDVGRRTWEAHVWGIGQQARRQATGGMHASRAACRGRGKRTHGRAGPPRRRARGGWGLEGTSSALRWTTGRPCGGQAAWHEGAAVEPRHCC